MLQIDPAVTVLHVVTVVLLCLGLAGISVGLGARLPSLREDNPSKIAAGFGGTLNLLVSMAFIFAMILLLALPGHLYFVSLDPEYTAQGVNFLPLRRWLVLSMVSSLALAVAATSVPMRLGIRHLRTLEF
jgi:ABC-2 type transport system permease protein